MKRPFTCSIAAAMRWCGVALILLACAPGAARAVSCANKEPLQLGSSVETLPPGRVDQPYQYTLQATGGTPPYAYHATSLPPGFTISIDGRLSVEPVSLPVITVFVASVRDQRGCVAQQTYKLAIVAPRQSSPLPAPAPAPMPKPPLPPVPAPSPKPQPVPEPLTTVPLTDTLAAPFSPESAMDVYLLTDAILKDEDVLIELKQMSVDATAGILGSTDEPDDAGKDTSADKDPGKDGSAKDEAPTEDSAGDDGEPQVDETIDADVKAQFQRMLQPLIGVEYPEQELFAAALDTRLCRFSNDLIIAAAKKRGVPVPASKESDCPPDWAKLANQNDYTLPNPLPWNQVPRWLMRPAMRSLLIDKARRSHPLLNLPAPQWAGKGCGCVRQLTGEIYGFYPYWHNQDKPVPLDFSVLSRASVAALWFRDDGELVVPEWKTPESTDFIREAHSHRTALDYTLYHNDWRFLKDASSDAITDITQRLAVQAANFIDRPLTDLVSRSHAWVPGFGEIERYGSGLTLYLDQIPTSEDQPLRKVFQHYLNRQIRELIAELRRRNRHYVLNIVLRDADLTIPGGIWKVDQMAEYLRLAESIDPRGNSVANENVRTHSSTNLSLRYLVLLSQPTDHSMREVLATIDRDKTIDEEACRVLLHRVIPIFSTGASPEPDLYEDLAYASDNFGGAGFWAAPSLDLHAGRVTSARIRGSFLQRAQRAEQLNAWICEYRWPLRIVTEVLLLAWLVAFLLYQSSCRFRQVGLPFQWGLLLGAIAFLMLGALLLAGDPALAQLRQGNTLLGLLLIVLIAVIGYHMLKPRVEKP